MSDLSPLSGEEQKLDFGAVRSVDDPDITRTRHEPRGDPRSLVIRRRSILSRRLVLFREEFSDLHPVVPQPRADRAPSLNALAVYGPAGVGRRIARYVVSGWALIWL